MLFRCRTQPSAVLVLDLAAVSSISLSTSTTFRAALVAFAEKCLFFSYIA